MEENNQKNENVKSKAQVNEAKGKTKKKGNGKIALLIIMLILIIAIVAGIIFYFAYYTKPEQTYKRLLEATMNSYSSQLNDADYKTSKTSIKLDANIDTDSHEIDKNVLDLINNINVGLEVQTNNEDKQLVLNLESKYEKEDLLNIQMYSDIDEQKTYICLKNLLDKYIEADVDDEFYSSLSELLDNQKNIANKNSSMKKANEILKKELSNVIKAEYCSSQKEDITVNGKTVNTTKNIIKMNAKQLKDEFTVVLNNLKGNEEFLNCFENKDNISNSLENLIDEYEDLDDDNKSTVEIATYTEGLMQKVVKLSFTVYSEENNQTLTLAFTKSSENIYEFEILTDNNTKVCSGTMNIEKKNDNEGALKLEFTIQDFGKVSLNIACSQKFNEDIDKVDVKNSVNSDELSTADQMKLVTNLQKSKLYELIESFSGSSLTDNTFEDETTTYDEY